MGAGEIGENMCAGASLTAVIVVYVVHTAAILPAVVLPYGVLPAAILTAVSEHRKDVCWCEPHRCDRYGFGPYRCHSPSRCPPLWCPACFDYHRCFSAPAKSVARVCLCYRFTAVILTAVTLPAVFLASGSDHCAGVILLAVIRVALIFASVI